MQKQNTHDSFSFGRSSSSTPFNVSPFTGREDDTEDDCRLLLATRLVTLRAFGSWHSFEVRDLAFSCSENRSDVERARVGDVASGGGDDGRVDVGESRKELACDIVRTEGTEEDAVGVAEADPRLSKGNGGTNVSGDAGFRRSVSVYTTRLKSGISYDVQTHTRHSEDRHQQKLERFSHLPYVSDMIYLYQANIVLLE